MRRRRRLNLVVVLSALPLLLAVTLWVGLRDKVPATYQPGDPYTGYLAFFGHRVTAAAPAWNDVQTLVPATAPFLALLPLMVLAQQFTDESDDANWPDVLRVTAGLICWATFLADLGDVLVYSPSGRGSTPAENFGKTLTSCAAPLLGCYYLFMAGTRLVRGRAIGRTGRCAACGYDLRATPGRCPECGATASVSITE